MAMVDWKTEGRVLAVAVAGFAALYALPVGEPRFDGAVIEAFHLVKWYAREHVLLCLVPAFLIAGAIGAFVSQGAVMRHLGAEANKIIAYGVASVSGALLAVCSCTVLPLFAGIHRMGAGLGPAVAFLYAGPAINVLAIVLTARVLGPELGVARAVGAVVFSVVIGLVMQALFPAEKPARGAAMAVPGEEGAGRPLWRTALFFAALVGVLVFANLGAPDGAGGPWAEVVRLKWWLAAFAAAGLGVALALWFGFGARKVSLIAATVLVVAWLAPAWPEAAFLAGTVALCAFASRDPGEAGEWFALSWEFARRIVPLLLFGVLLAGLLLGRPGHEGLIPSAWIAGAVGGNSLAANLFAALAGAFMYFATLTEVPIVEGLIGAGMGKGPALALLLAGPALSLPSMLVIRGVLGTRRTLAYVALVVVMATLSGWVFGALFD